MELRSGRNEVVDRVDGNMRTSKFSGELGGTISDARVNIDVVVEGEVLGERVKLIRAGASAELIPSQHGHPKHLAALDPLSEHRCCPRVTTQR